MFCSRNGRSVVLCTSELPSKKQKEEIMEDKKDIETQIRHTYLTGGTGVLTKKDGERIYILSTTLTQFGDDYIAINEVNKKEIKIPKSSLLKAEPSYVPE